MVLPFFICFLLAAVLTGTHAGYCCTTPTLPIGFNGYIRSTDRYDSYQYNHFQQSYLLICDTGFVRSDGGATLFGCDFGVCDMACSANDMSCNSQVKWASVFTQGSTVTCVALSSVSATPSYSASNFATASSSERQSASVLLSSTTSACATAPATTSSHASFARPSLFNSPTVRASSSLSTTNSATPSFSALTSLSPDVSASVSLSLHASAASAASTASTSASSSPGIGKAGLSAEAGSSISGLVGLVGLAGLISLPASALLLFCAFKKYKLGASRVASSKTTTSE